MIDDVAFHFDLKRIADALETIAAHLANPLVTLPATSPKDGVWPAPVDGGPGNRVGERPLQVGDRVKATDRTGVSSGRIHAIARANCQVFWDNTIEPSSNWWPLKDFERIAE